MASAEFRICDPSLLEFVNVMTRAPAGTPPVSAQDAARQADLSRAQFPVLYPSEHQFRLALYGMNT